MPSSFGKCRRRLRTIGRFSMSRFTENGAILLYHRVVEDSWDPFKLCVSPRHFAEELAALDSLGEVLDIGEFARRQAEGSLGRGSFCITFDDGCVDFLDYALPLLEARELPATVYCVAEGLGDSLWWDRLHEILASAEGAPRVRLEDDDGELVIDSGWSLTDAFHRLYEDLKDRRPPFASPGWRFWRASSARVSPSRGVGS